MKSITDMTFKDSAQVDCRVLTDKLLILAEELYKVGSGEGSKVYGDRSYRKLAVSVGREVNNIARNMSRLLQTIEAIQEVPREPNERKKCPQCGRLMSDREASEQAICNDCQQ